MPLLFQNWNSRYSSPLLADLQLFGIVEKRSHCVALGNLELSMYVARLKHTEVYFSLPLDHHS